MKTRLPGIALTFLVCLSCFLVSVKSYSQSFIFQTGKIKWEAGVNIGPSEFLGDMGGNAGHGTTFIKDINLELTNIMKGAFLSIYPNDCIGLRFSVGKGKLEASDGIIDTKGVNELWRKERNLDFRSNISEAQIGLEIFPLMLLSSFHDDPPRLRPFGFLGIGLFHFNPQGSITTANGDKTWVYLHPLRTEGEGMKEYPGRQEYKLTQYNIPIGFGLKYFLSDRFTLSTEFLYRKTFTDYIDDVSTFYIDPKYFDQYLSPADALIARQVHDKTFGIVNPGITRYAPGTMRGNPKQADAYFSLFLKIGVRLGPIYESSFQKGAIRQARCPHIF